MKKKKFKSGHWSLVNDMHVEVFNVCNFLQNASKNKKNWWIIEGRLDKAMATHSSTLAWKIPWTEGPGGMQSMGSLGVGHDWETLLYFFFFFFHTLEKEMATHSSVLAWRIPGIGEPGRLPSMGSHRVGHDWSNLAAAAAAAEGRLKDYPISNQPPTKITENTG